MPNLFQSILTGTLTLESYLICTAVALVCGVLAVLVASFRSHPSKSFLLSILLLPAIVETVIFMVNGSVGTGIAVAGAFSLVRFRSVPGKAKEIALLFLAMTAGLACATGRCDKSGDFKIGVVFKQRDEALTDHTGCADNANLELFHDGTPFFFI